MNAQAIQLRTVKKDVPSNAATSVQVISKNDERLEQVVGDMADKKTMLQQKRAYNTKMRRDEWTH